MNHKDLESNFLAAFNKAMVNLDEARRNLNQHFSTQASAVRDSLHAALDEAQDLSKDQEKLLLEELTCKILLRLMELREPKK